MRALPLAILAVIAAPALAQDEVLQPIEPQAAMAPDALAQARAAAARGDAAEALSRYLRVLSAEPDNVAALTGAGGAALAVGDLNAAVGFYARAEDRSPRDGTIKAGLASAMAQLGRAREALRFFSDAVLAGVAPAMIAADRGLAYDLTGQPKRAQLDYALALRSNPSAEVTRRLALSQAIGGDRVSALATLDPLLRRQDVAAWRTRAFVYAITGDVVLAGADARAVMPADQAAALQPYLTRLSTLKPAEKAAAVYLGRFPSDVRSAAAAPARATLAARPAIVSTPPQSGASAPAPLAQAARPTLAMDGAVLARDGTVIEGLARNGVSTGRATISGPAFSPTDGAQFAYVNPLATPPPAPTPASARAVAPTPDIVVPLPSYVVRAPIEPAGPTRTERAAQLKVDRAAVQAKIAAAAKIKADRVAAVQAKANPGRQWVQVAGGANKKDLPKAWAKLKAQWPVQLAGKSPWTMAFRFTNRLLIGPFASEDAAQDYVSDRRKEGFATFRVETNSGTPVERLAAK